ncbi:MAG TPA: YncE family protein [Candidatus Acidoferrum sp.]|jgi:hypothetical protein|nr:YncE family protein [Candidatus Acidoferrum sp.]
MKTFPLVSLLAISAVGTTAVASAQPPSSGAPLRLVRTIALPASDRGSFDHIAVDAKRHRLFLTPEDQHAVVVVDLDAGRVVDRIAGVARPHAVLYRDDVDKLFVTDGGDGSLKVFNGATYQLEKRIALRKDADSIGYDPSTTDLYIDNGGKDADATSSYVSVVDTTGEKKLADIPLASETLEAMALDTYRPRLYVNDAAGNKVIVVDRWTRKPIAAWPVTLGKQNVAIALDEQRERLYVACRSGQIVVFNSTTGKELRAFPTLHGVDDLAFDRATKRLYAAGDGAVAVYQELDANHEVMLARIPTGPKAKTARVLSEQNEYVTVVPAHGAQAPAVLVFRMNTTWKNPNPAAPFAYDPDAPAAEQLVMSTLSEHPFLRKLGLHGIKPGQKVSVLLANGNATRRGIETTAGDFAAVKGPAPYGPLIPDGSFYNIKLPMFDAAGRHIGLIVMEIPSSAARDQHDAIVTAEKIRKEVSLKIPSLDSLFGHGG